MTDRNDPGPPPLITPRQRGMLALFAASFGALAALFVFRPVSVCALALTAIVVISIPFSMFTGYVTKTMGGDGHP